MSVRLALTATLAVAFAAAPALADDATTMTGDWGGARTRLVAAGVTLRADYVSETFDAVQGGLRHGAAYTDQFRFGADFDMGRLAGWSGTTLHLTFNDRSGKGLSSSYIGNRLPVQEAYGGQYAKLTEASIEQNLADGRLDLRAGFFAMGTDLGGMALGCNLVNAAFCAHPLSLSGDSGWYNYPNARWGLAVRYRLGADLLLRTGLYQVNPSLGTKGNAFKPFAKGTTGVMAPLELEYDPGAATSPGHYKLGVYYDNSRAARQGESGTVKGRYGAYVLADQTVLSYGGHSLAVFGQYTQNPKASAQITRWEALGLVQSGTFRGHDADTIAVGIVHAELNAHLHQVAEEEMASADSYAALPAGETVLGLSYGWQVQRWLILRPDVQYVIDPGAFSSRVTPNAVAIGLQVKSQF